MINCSMAFCIQHTALIILQIRFRKKIRLPSCRFPLRTGHSLLDNLITSVSCVFSDGLSWAHRRSAARGRGELGWPAGVWATTTVSQWCVSAVWYADRHVGINMLVPPLHLINGCVRKQPPFQAPQTFQNKQLLLSGLLSIRAAAEDERARARSFSPRFCFPCNLSFSHFISNLSIHHSDNQLVFHPAIVVHLELMLLSLFGGNPFIYMTNVVLNYCKNI